MELSPEDRQRIYEEEKARLEARTSLEAEAASKVAADKPMSALGIGCLSVLGLLVVFWIIAIILSNNNSSGWKPAATDPPVDNSTKEERTKRGCQVAKIKFGDKPIAELTLENLQILQLCKSLGY